MPCLSCEVHLEQKRFVCIPVKGGVQRKISFGLGLIDEKIFFLNIYYSYVVRKKCFINKLDCQIKGLFRTWSMFCALAGQEMLNLSQGLCETRALCGSTEKPFYYVCSCDLGLIFQQWGS